MSDMSDISDTSNMRSLEKEIRKKGSRGGTNITNDWLQSIIELINQKDTIVDKETRDSVNYLRICQERADAYDWTEYFDQMPKIEKLEKAVNEKMKD